MKKITNIFIINLFSCFKFGSPLMLSWPHFFQADRKLLDDVEGLEPRKERHQFHIDILPAMGVGMRASVTTQVYRYMEYGAFSCNILLVGFIENNKTDASFRSG